MNAQSLIFALQYYLPILSRYSGWGLGDLGALLSGYFTVFAADNNRHARECFRLNHPHSPIFNIDLAYASPFDMLKLAGLKIGQAFGYLVSAPCQGASKAGKQMTLDMLNLLMLNEPYHISQVRPVYFVFENVASLFDSNMGFLMNTLMAEVKKWLFDYDVYFMELNAASFGVPQSRRRFIMYGVLKELNIAPVVPLITQEKPTVIGDVIPGIDGLRFGYRDQNFRDASQVAPTCTSTPNLKMEIDRVYYPFDKPQIYAINSIPNWWESPGSVTQCYNRAGNSFLAQMAQAVFEPMLPKLIEAGVPLMHLDELLELTEKSIPQSLLMDK